MGNARIVYRLGSATDDALTPRAKDTQSFQGQKPGLSVEAAGPPASGQKAQKIDLTLLEHSGLGFFPDDPASGGREGHGVIVPVDSAGNVDQALLEEWASWRGTGRQHRFTTAILNAIAEKDVRSSS
jgi:hypothetical protein